MKALRRHPAWIGIAFFNRHIGIANRHNTKVAFMRMVRNIAAHCERTRANARTNAVANRFNR